jgi:hypothetical protein
VRLTERDVEIIRFINNFGFCEMGQIEKRFSLKKPRNYEVMRRLIRNGFVNHKRIYYGSHGVYFVSTKGAKYTDLPPLDRISQGQYDHQITIIKVYLKLMQQYPYASWISERKLKHDKFFDGVGKRGHLSDGVLLFPDGKQIAVEIEMSVKGKNRIEQIIKGYVKQLSIKEVWYYCLPHVFSIWMAATVKIPFIKIFNLEEFLS